MKVCSMLSDRGVSNATSNISSATGPEAECAITVRDAVANYCLAHFTNATLSITFLYRLLTPVWVLLKLMMLKLKRYFLT
jgi:hypothetical protein